MIFGVLNPEKNLTSAACTFAKPHLYIVATLPWEIKKVIFQQCYVLECDWVKCEYTISLTYIIVPNDVQWISQLSDIQIAMTETHLKVVKKCIEILQPKAGFVHWNTEVKHVQIA